MVVPVKPQSYCKQWGRQRCLLVEWVSGLFKRELNTDLDLKCLIRDAWISGRGTKKFTQLLILFPTHKWQGRVKPSLCSRLLWSLFSAGTSYQQGGGISISPLWNQAAFWGGRRSEIEDFGSCDLFPSTLPCLFSAAQMSSSVPKQKRLRNKEKSFSCRISFLANFPEESLFKSFPWVVPYYTFAQRLVFPSFFLSRVAAMVFTFCFHYHSCNYKELALARRFMGHILRMPSESTWLMSPGCKDVQPSLSQLPPFPRKIRDPSLLNLARYRQGTQCSGRETQSEFVRSLPAGHPMSKCLGKARRKVHPYRMASAWGHIPSPSSVPSLSCGEITACSA